MIGKTIVFRALATPLEYKGKCVGETLDDAGRVLYLHVEIKGWFRRKVVKAYLSQIVSIT